MSTFLSENGPWSQLVERKNVLLKELKNGDAIHLSEALKVTPFLVPHRDEYSETVGYRIEGENRSAIFIPDIDKWEKWEVDILALVKEVDFAFLDATFYSGEEIGHRDISQIPHPFVIESMKLFDELPMEHRSKIIFIHFNHTNPLIDPESEESKTVLKKGYRIAEKGDVFSL
jgi:pyrroloquinoline quinone biosynthesis protein B